MPAVDGSRSTVVRIAETFPAPTFHSECWRFAPQGESPPPIPRGVTDRSNPIPEVVARVLQLPIRPCRRIQRAWCRFTGGRLKLDEGPFSDDSQQRSRRVGFGLIDEQFPVLQRVGDLSVGRNNRLGRMNIEPLEVDDLDSQFVLLNALTQTGE